MMRAFEFINEKWSDKYKRSINCSNPKGFSQRAHCQGRKKNEDVEQDPGEPISFPKGTTSINVSDPYDWYKLGMVISDLDDANPQAFGKGGPSTVISFGSEEEEHRLLPHLKRLGLKLQDIDKPSDTRKIVPAKALIDKLEETEQLDELNIPQTLNFIKQAHGSQLYGKLPYWRHPRAVAMTGKKIFGNKFNSDAVKVAFLHDVVEDTNIRLDELSKLDFSPEVIEAVGLLTKDKTLGYSQNIERIINSGNSLAMMVKYADNYENWTGDKSEWDPDRAAKSQKKYLMSLNMLGDKLGVKHHVNQGVTENQLSEAQTFDFASKKQTILQFINNVLANKPNNRQYNPFYELIVGDPKAGAANKLGFNVEFVNGWKKYFQNPAFVGGAPEPWSQFNINDQFAKATGDDRTLNFYITVDKEKNNIAKFLSNINKLPSYLKPISDQYQTPIKFKTHSLLDSFIGHNDSLKVYYYDPKVKDLVVNATKKWLNDAGIVSGSRSHEHGVDVKTGGGSFGQILSNHVYDSFTKLIQSNGNKYTPEQYYQWLEKNLTLLIKQVQQSPQGVAENFADGKNPGRKGLAKRSGVPTKASVSRLRQIAKSSSGEKQRMSHWLANMKAGKKK